MGDTHYDPTDRHRTTLPRAGITMKDNFFWPGFILLTIAILGTVGTVAVAAYRHYEWLTGTVVVAILGAIAGTLWIIVERRHVTILETSAADGGCRCDSQLLTHNDVIARPARATTT